MIKKFKSRCEVCFNLSDCFRFIFKIGIFCVLSGLLFSVENATAQGVIKIGNTFFTGCDQVVPVEGSSGKEHCCASPKDHPLACQTTEKDYQKGPAVAKKPFLKKASESSFDFNQEFSKFCNDLKRKAESVLPNATATDASSKSVNLAAIKNDMVLTPCGSQPSKLAEKINELFRSEIGRFCVQATALPGGKGVATESQLQSSWVVAPAEIDKSVQLENSCILGPVKLVGSHRLSSTVIIGGLNGEPLIIDLNKPDKLQVITWKPGLYYGNGPLKLEKTSLQPQSGYIGGESYSTEIDSQASMAPSQASRNQGVVNLNQLSTGTPSGVIKDGSSGSGQKNRTGQ